MGLMETMLLLVLPIGIVLATLSQWLEDAGKNGR